LEASSSERRHIWVPPGFANGFCALADETIVEYKFTELYNGGGEGNILWNDPEVGIRWPVAEPVISERDRSAPRLRDWLTSPESDYFRYQA
jgi:dTDP-4-dehydrorhamnose 3,5-epimerase